jgi:Tol biopolymer transport system component
MTFESRARGAVLDIHRAVEVMEMSTRTDQKQPGTVERFDRFRDRKQRNRRIGAILVAGALVVAAILVVSTNMLGQDEEVVPAVPGSLEGRILYKVFDGGIGEELFAMDAAGGPAEDLGVLTDPGARWSPDGARILVTSTAGPEATSQPIRPATVASDGTDFRLLDGVSDPTLNLVCSAFSPDGSRLACNGYGDAVGGVYSVRASDGGGLRALTDFTGFPGDFSPDGEEIVVLGEDSAGATLPETGTLYVVKTDGTGLREITPPSSVLWFSFAAWSPDGEWIVFIDADGRLSLVHPDGSGLHEIALDPDASIDVATGGATWSPDGQWIAFSARAAGADTSDIYVVQPDGTDLRQVTDTPEVAEFTPDWIP